MRQNSSASPAEVGIIEASPVPSVSRETEARLEALEREFRKWAARINLVAPSTLSDLKTRHIADSLAVTALLGEARTVIDLGSGGGFPGLVIGCVFAGKPGAQVHLVESIAKKCAFLRHAARELALPVTVHNARIEDVIGGLAAADVITARALAPLPLLLSLAGPQWAKGARGLFHKGREWREEVLAAHGAWRFDLLVHANPVEAGSVLISLSGVAARDADGHPRRPA
jgi:16S rRNA (guanine527-N7)-methyltransferase